MSRALLPMVSGMLAAGYLVAALFFLRFWSRTRDQLFACFAGAFGLLALQRVLTILTAEWLENDVWLYLLRLLAFSLIIGGILAKNRAPER